MKEKKTRCENGKVGKPKISQHPSGRRDPEQARHPVGWSANNGDGGDAAVAFPYPTRSN